jgi:hypothetical protein
MDVLPSTMLANSVAKELVLARTALATVVSSATRESVAPSRKLGVLSVLEHAAANTHLPATKAALDVAIILPLLFDHARTQRSRASSSEADTSRRRIRPCTSRTHVVEHSTPLCQAT